MAKQPCVSCGDETATGSPLYSSRTKIEMRDGQPGFLCSDCHVRITGHDRGELTQEELHKLQDGASGFAFGFSQDH